MKKNTGYAIDFTKNTVTITKKFADSASLIGTPEFNIMKELRSMGLSILIKEAPKHKNHNITYKKMEKYISCLTTAEEDMKEFVIIKEASLSESNPYLFVKQWFEAKYPTRGEVPQVDTKTNKIVAFPKNYDSEEAAI